MGVIADMKARLSALVLVVIIAAAIAAWLFLRPPVVPILGEWELAEVIGIPQGYTLHPRYRYGARWDFFADNTSTNGLWQIDERGRLVFPFGLSRTAHDWHVGEPFMTIYGYIVSVPAPTRLFRVDLVFVRVE